MEFKEQRDYYPEEDDSSKKEIPTSVEENESSQAPTDPLLQNGEMPTDHLVEKPWEEKKVSIHFLISVVCIVAAISILLTFVVTNNANRYAAQNLLPGQNIGNKTEGDGIPDLDQLDVLAQVFAKYSYYAGELSEEELLTAVMKAYAAATGDAYAE